MFNSFSNVESSCEEEVSEEDNLPVEDNDSSELPLHQGGNQLEFIPSMKAENAGFIHAPQRNFGTSTERLKDLPCKEREPTIRQFVLGTKLKRMDRTDEFEKYFSPSEDHKGNLIYIADINV